MSAVDLVRIPFLQTPHCGLTFIVTPSIPNIYGSIRLCRAGHRRPVDSYIQGKSAGFRVAPPVIIPIVRNREKHHWNFTFWSISDQLENGIPTLRRQIARSLIYKAIQTDWFCFNLEMVPFDENLVRKRLQLSSVCIQNIVPIPSIARNCKKRFQFCHQTKHRIIYP
jgi:hypothetical protein